MKQLLIIFFCLLPGITFAYSGELEIKNLQFQVEQLEKSQDDYKQIIYWTLGFIGTFFLAFNGFSLYQNWKIDKKELENIREELENNFSKATISLQNENKSILSNSIKKIDLDIDSKIKSKLQNYLYNINEIEFKVFEQKENKDIHDFINQITKSSKHSIYDLTEVLDLLEKYLEKNKSILQEYKYEINEKLNLLLKKYKTQDPIETMVRTKTKSLKKQLGDLD